ncbi:hypothetical protein [Limnofasciculus baicalensis]|uniref:Uncharacterized protein n=1 Tax=Limnofasciculus baicalensis BBK-W-15 TaxID=2699891 RepID=A0AAE3GTN1_9CYAN|nr:hypothetical protein [Limnofasciculus baicalensis]MCP2729543.1 hypothetical protein [Limnofasciculus baicalensis BBK-W-15]
MGSVKSVFSKRLIADIDSSTMIRQFLPPPLQETIQIIKETASVRDRWGEQMRW